MRKRVWIVKLVFLLLLSAGTAAYACETTEVTVTLALNASAPVSSGIPSPPTSFSALEAASELDTTIPLIDVQGSTRVAVLYVFQVASGVWQASMFIGGEAISGGVPGVPVPLGSVLFTFDNDGSLAVTQFVSIEPLWANDVPPSKIGFVLAGAILTNQSKIVSAQQNGSVYGCIRPGVYSDFDRDGTDDYVVFQRSNGTWIVSLSSSNGTSTLSRQFGRKGDYPIVGDYTNDGRPDLVLWRPKSGSWVICRSDLNLDCNQAQTKFYGSSSDRAVRGDFDGDGILDLAVRSRRTGRLSYLSSASNTTVYRQIGGKSDVPLGVAVSE